MKNCKNYFQFCGCRYSYIYEYVPMGHPKTSGFQNLCNGAPQLRKGFIVPLLHFVSVYKE
jgi:hypothetical protein